MKILTTIFHVLFITLVVGIAGLLIGTMLPIPGNIEIKIVKSGSMEPTIPTGSIVIIKPMALYSVGDVVTFGKDTASDIPTTHRIIATSPDGSFITQGDANEEEDQTPLARKDVIGKVIAHVPGAGFVLDFARQPLGFALLVAIPAGLVIIEEVLTIIAETRKWMRRRRGDDDQGGGTPIEEDLTMHLKRVYAKRRAMDEIKVAIFVEPRWTESMWWRKRLGLDSDSYGTATSLTMGLIFFSTLFAGNSGGTIAYFQDIERSIGNILAAGTWEDATPEEVPIAAFSLITEDGESAPDEEGAVLGTSDEEDDNSGSAGGEGGGGSESEEVTPIAPEESTEDGAGTEGESTSNEESTTPEGETPPEEAAPEPTDEETPASDTPPQESAPENVPDPEPATEESQESATQDASTE